MRPLLCALVLAACSHRPPVATPPAATISLPEPAPAPPPLPLPEGVPDTVAGHQLAWVLDVLARDGSVEKPALEAHFSPTFLAQVPADKLATAFAQLASHVGGMKIADVKAKDENHLVLRGSAPDGRFAITLAVGASEKIEGLLILPDTGGRPASMDDATRMLAAVAPRTQLLVAALDRGTCRPVFQLNATDELAIGSIFKLYVLLGLADRIAAGKARWDDTLAVRDDWKSLPSGVTQDDPAGTRLSIRELAERMISISDNTAADLLLYTVGRRTVEAAMRRTGHALPRLNTPFLGTRELFWFKLAMPVADVEKYLDMPLAQRRKFLRGLAGKVPTMEHVDEWKTPRFINRLEWFASAADLCRLEGALWSRAQKRKAAPLLDVLAKNAGLDAEAKAGWSYVGFKGGSEPGVMALSWLLRRTDGKWFVVTLAANGPDAIDEGALLGIAYGVIQILAKEGHAP